MTENTEVKELSNTGKYNNNFDTDSHDQRSLEKNK